MGRHTLISSRHKDYKQMLRRCWRYTKREVKGDWFCYGSIYKCRNPTDMRSCISSKSNPLSSITDSGHGLLGSVSTSRSCFGAGDASCAFPSRRIVLQIYSRFIKTLACGRSSGSLPTAHVHSAKRRDPAGEVHIPSACASSL